MSPRHVPRGSTSSARAVFFAPRTGIGLVLGGGTAGSAMSISTSPTPDVDCTKYPNNQECQECGQGGTLNCCHLNRKDTGCIVRKVMTVVELPSSTTTTMLPLRRLGYPVLRGY
jgi:hypothetical protein